MDFSDAPKYGRFYSAGHAIEKNVSAMAGGKQMDTAKAENVRSILAVKHIISVV